MLKVFGYAGSINVRKVLWACAELGLDYEREDWGGGTRSTGEPAFLAMNPVGMVPVIDDDGVVVWESNAIVRYLATSRGRLDLSPADPAERARVEMWMDWQGSDFNNSWRPAFLGLVRKRPEFSNPQVIERSLETFDRLVGCVDDQLAGSGGFICGPTFTMADIPIGLSLHRWRSLPRSRPARPNVEAYYERLSERDGFRRFGREGGP
jgi:glutathione S-transferase